MDTWLDKAERVSRNIINGNIQDAKRELKSQSREQRYKTIICLKDDVSESTWMEWVKIAITGNFK